jgi:hypothetical protein
VRFLFLRGFSSSLLSPSLLDDDSFAYSFALRLTPTIFLGAGFSSSLDDEDEASSSAEEEDSSSSELTAFFAFFLPF